MFWRPSEKEIVWPDAVSLVSSSNFDKVPPLTPIEM
jgi:hypothetical protein